MQHFQAVSSYENKKICEDDKKTCQPKEKNAPLSYLPRDFIGIKVLKLEQDHWMTLPMLRLVQIVQLETLISERTIDANLEKQKSRQGRKHIFNKQMKRTWNTSL
jgi:hypothetical protein